MSQLRGKTALIAGAGCNNGKAIALAPARYVTGDRLPSTVGKGM